MRRSYLPSATLFLISGLAVAASGCGGKSAEAPPPGSGNSAVAPVTAPKATPTPSRPIEERPNESRRPLRAVPPSEYAQGAEVETWKKGLKQGAIEYRVPAAMQAQQPSAVTVKIHGYQDASGWQPMPGATGNGNLKVSSRMKVELIAPLNPAEFTITPQNSEAVQFVPNDGAATWMWNVTPAYKATDQKLEIRVSLVYQVPGSTLEEPLDDQYYPVTVDVQKLSVANEHDFQKDPVGWLKYMLPGGSGWGALAALVTSLGGLAWWKRKKKPAARASGKKDA